MANHAKVASNEPISIAMVNRAMTLIRLRLGESFRFDYSDCRGDSGAWGPHVWLTSFIEGGEDWGGRVCWLNEDGSFEIRHGGGGDFVWWIDHQIVNEIALICGGEICDDSSDQPYKPEAGKYDDFREYVKRVWGENFPPMFEQLVPPSLQTKK